MYVALYHFFRIMSILGSHFLTGFWYILQYFEGLWHMSERNVRKIRLFTAGKEKPPQTICGSFL